jgi:hypothetical protein
MSDPRMEASSGGIPSRLSGLITELLRHVLSLGALAAEETRLLIRQSLTGILLFIALILMLMISYLAGVIAAASLLVSGCGFGWSATLGLISLIHLFLAGGFSLILRVRRVQRPYEATSAELQRDLEVLGGSPRRTP